MKMHASKLQISKWPKQVRAGHREEREERDRNKEWAKVSVVRCALCIWYVYACRCTKYNGEFSPLPTFTQYTHTHTFFYVKVFGTSAAAQAAAAYVCYSANNEKITCTLNYWNVRVSCATEEKIDWNFCVYHVCVRVQMNRIKRARAQHHIPCTRV